MKLSFEQIEALSPDLKWGIKELIILKVISPPSGLIKLAKRNNDS